jgi:hypothetical protein
VVNIRTSAVIIGILFLIGFGVLSELFTGTLITVLILDLIKGALVALTGIVIYPILKEDYKYFAPEYLIIRVIEGLILIVVAFSPIVMGIPDSWTLIDTI